jgi:mRNA-degrading endonuclease toxin of MazEF toxin-antitoxin module
MNEARRHLDRRRRQDYASKPRPVVIVQDDSFDATDSITICAFTTGETEAPLIRLPVEPNERNGLCTACRLPWRDCQSEEHEDGLIEPPVRARRVLRP